MNIKETFQYAVGQAMQLMPPGGWDLILSDATPVTEEADPPPSMHA